MYDKAADKAMLNIQFCFVYISLWSRLGKINLKIRPCPQLSVLENKGIWFSLSLLRRKQVKSGMELFWRKTAEYVWDLLFLLYIHVLY